MKSRNFADSLGLAVLIFSVYLTFIVSWAYWLTLLGGVIYFGSWLMPRDKVEEDQALGFYDILVMPNTSFLTKTIVWGMRIAAIIAICLYFPTRSPLYSVIFGFLFGLSIVFAIQAVKKTRHS